MKDRYVLVKGCAGLGNRMYTLAAAIAYAKKTNRKICVDWRDGVCASPEKNAFAIALKLVNVDVIEIESLISLKQISCYPASLQNQLNKSLYELFCPASSGFLGKLPGNGRLHGRWSRLNAYWYYQPGNNFGKEISSAAKALEALFSSAHVEEGHNLPENCNEDVVLFADFWPGDVAKQFFSFVELNAEMKHRVEATMAELNVEANTIGVHVRASDKQHGKDIRQLADKLRTEVSERRKVFLCTDNPSVEREISSQLGAENVILLKKFSPERKDKENMHHYGLRSGDYASAENIFIESLVDNRLLASCTKVYYQGNSSFSKLALSWNSKVKEAIDWLK